MLQTTTKEQLKLQSTTIDNSMTKQMSAKDGKREPKYPQFGVNLLALRKSRHLTQNQLVEILNVKRGAYTMWEAGYSRPDPEMEKKIANYYNISVDDLFNKILTESINNLHQPAEAQAMKEGLSLKEILVDFLNGQKDIINHMAETTKAAQKAAQSASDAVENMAKTYVSRRMYEADLTSYQYFQEYVLGHLAELKQMSFEEMRAGMGKRTANVRR